MERGLEANVLFSRGQYAEALRAYTASLESLAATTRNDFKVNLLFNRSACYLKLKSYDKVVEDCETILSLDRKNGKAIGRKIKAMCSLGNFREAQAIAKNWIKEDPKNIQAKKELERLDVIIKALNEQASEDDGLDLPNITSFNEVKCNPETILSLDPSSGSRSYSPARIKHQPLHNAWTGGPASPPQPAPSTSPRVVASIPYAAVASPKSSLSNSSPYMGPSVQAGNHRSSASPSFGLSTTMPSSNSPVLGVGEPSQIDRASPLNRTKHPSPAVPSYCNKERYTPPRSSASPITAVPSLSPHLAPTGADERGAICVSITQSLEESMPCSGVKDEQSMIPDASSSPLETPLRENVSTNVGTLKTDNIPSSLVKVKTDKHQNITRKDWKHRPPPRGLTSQEYTQCPRYFGDGTCRFANQCSQAHSAAELEEWRERFESNKQEAQKTREDGKSKGFQYLEAIVKKMINTDNIQSLLTDSIEGVKVHINSDLKVNMSTKKCNHTWLFTITSKMKTLEKVGLLDDSTRKQFYISEVTVGPKRSQKKQDIESHCQLWSNPSKETKTMNERVCRVRVCFSTDIYGTFRQTVVLDFGSEPLVSRDLCVDSNPVSDLDKLTQDLVLKENERWDASNKTIIIFDPKPHSYSTQEEELLTTFPPPTAINFTVSEALLEDGLTRDNYQVRMHDLLNIEEMAQYSSVSKYNVVANLQLVDRFMLMPSSTQSDMKFAQNGELYGRLKLNSNLSEDSSHGRLILQNVHTVYIAPDHIKADQEAEQVYEAIVEDKGKNFIFLRLSKICVDQLRLRSDMEVSIQVQFQLNRLPLCEMHLAVDKLPDLHAVFPDVNAMSNIPWNPLRQWTDKLDTRLNPKQKEAIVAITSASDVRLPPILLVGPYGTGKTFTLAQAAKAILRQENTRILICTHSNSAADLYVKEYLHPYVDEEGHTEAKPLRILYRHRWVQTVPFTVLQYCLRNRERFGPFFRMPTKEDVEAHRVVVATLSTSRYLHNIGLEPGFFTHILLDEAAQAMECELLLPIGLGSDATKIVLAGDHMQLSPEVHSDFARDRDLHVSCLERLYDLYPAEHPCKILLCENYRSHKAIIDYTSELFYDNKLVASGNQPGHAKFHPLTFFSAKGEDVQHQNSTAFYNNAEVYEVVERVAELQKNWPVSWGNMATGIGVVAPYADQVVRIRSELRKKKMFNVSVERVLNVQGKQFRVVILSTVRTQHTCSSDSAVEEFIDYGFLSNVKLLNTAITRAQSLVAVVGDPVSLCSIGKCRKLWERFIELCHQNGSLHGMTWKHIRAQLDGVELKKTYILNPLAPEFIPNRLRHAACPPPEPIAEGKFGYTFTPHPAMGAGGPQLWPPGTPPARFPPNVPMGPFIHPQMLYPPWMGMPGPGYYPMAPMFGSGMVPPYFMPHALPPHPRLPGQHRPPMMVPPPSAAVKGGSGPNSPGGPQEATLAGPPLHAAGNPFIYPGIRPGPADLAQHLIGQPLARLPVRAGSRQRQDSEGRPSSASSQRSDRHPSGGEAQHVALAKWEGAGGGPAQELERDPGIQFLPSACNVQRHEPAPVRFPGHLPPHQARINPVMFNHNLQHELAVYMSRKEGQDQASLFLNQMLHPQSHPQLPGNGLGGPVPHGAYGASPAPPPPRPPFENQGVPPHHALGNHHQVAPPVSPMVRGLRYSDLVSREHAGFQEQRVRSYAGVARVGGPEARHCLRGPPPPYPPPMAEHGGQAPQPSYHPHPGLGLNSLGAAGPVGSDAGAMEPEKPAVVEQAEHFLQTLEDSADSGGLRGLRESYDSTRMRGILHGSTDSAQLYSLLGNMDESGNSEQMENFYGRGAERKPGEAPLRLPDPADEVHSILSGLEAELKPERRESSGAVGDKLPLYLRNTGHTPDSTAAGTTSSAAVGAAVGSAAMTPGGAEEATARPMSYAGALRSRPPAPSPQAPPSRGDDVEEPDPLDLLKNLNIKASPGTQALYQYFS